MLLQRDVLLQLVLCDALHAGLSDDCLHDDLHDGLDISYRIPSEAQVAESSDVGSVSNTKESRL